MSTQRSLVARALLAAVGFYRRAISPVIGPRCRFAPTCSEYAQEAIGGHGAARGSWLAARRILKCAPWHPGGVDLVPEPPHPAGGPGTAQQAHSSEKEPGPGAGGPPRVPRPTRGRTPQQEAGVA